MRALISHVIAIPYFACTMQLFQSGRVFYNGALGVIIKEEKEQQAGRRVQAVIFECGAIFTTEIDLVRELVHLG